MKKCPATPEAISRAKSIANAKRLKHVGRLVLKIGKAGLIIAGVLTLIMAGIFGWNGMVVFFSSFIIWELLVLAILPSRRLEDWYPEVCVEEGLWDEVDRIAFASAGDALDDILGGRPPKGELNFDSFVLSKIEMILIRKGETRKSVRLSEYVLARMRAAFEAGGTEPPPEKGIPFPESNLLKLKASDYPEAISGEEGILGIGYNAVGKYSEGIDLARKRLDYILARPQEHVGRIFVAHLALLDVYLELHNEGEAEKVLNDLRNRLEFGPDVDPASPTGERSKAMYSWSHDEDAMFGWLIGRLKALKGDSEAEKILERSAEILRKQEEPRQLLLFPEIQISLALLAIGKKEFSRGEKYLQEALTYYEEKTRYLGMNFWLAKALFTFSRMKQGLPGEHSAELERFLQELLNSLEEGHLNIAACRAWLGESLLRDGKTGPAQETLEKALKTFRTHYPPGDSRIAEVQAFLAA